MMTFQIRVVDGRGLQSLEHGSFDDFGEAMRAGIRLADMLGRTPDYETARVKSVQLFAGDKRVLIITVVKGGLPDR